MLQADLSSPDIAGSQHDGDLHVEVLELADLGCNLGGPIWIDTRALGTGQGFAAKFEQNAPIPDRTHYRLLA
jgi:hypothetical protein